MRRHLEFFNAHPYFACWCLGAVAKLEEEALRKDFVDYRSIAIFKDRLGSTTGAVGDKLFWNMIKPIAAGIGVLVGVMGSVVAIPIFLIVFNVPHILFRVKGVFRGYKQGFDIVSEISMRRYGELFHLLYKLGAVISGMVIVASAAMVYKGSDTIFTTHNGNASLIAFVFSIPLTIILTRFKVSISTILLIVICVAAVFGYIVY